MPVFAGMNTLRCSYTYHSLDNYLDVDIPLLHLRKQHQLVKRPISPRQHFHRKTCRAKCPPWVCLGVGKAQGIKCGPVCFTIPGERKTVVLINQLGWGEACCLLTMLPERPHTVQPQSSLCNKEEDTVPTLRPQAGMLPPTLAWLSTAPTCQTKQQLYSCQSWNRTSVNHQNQKDLFVSICATGKPLQASCIYF